MLVCCLKREELFPGREIFVMWGGATSMSQRMQCAGEILQRPKEENLWCINTTRWTGDSPLPMVSEGSSLPKSLGGPVNDTQVVKPSLTSNIGGLRVHAGGQWRGLVALSDWFEAQSCVAANLKLSHPRSADVIVDYGGHRDAGCRSTLNIVPQVIRSGMT